MSKRTTQDDSRENRQVEIFGLTATKGRSNKYIPDATVEIDNKTYNLELKTSNIEKKAVSTARDFGENKIEAWKENDAFIFSQYEKTDDGFKFIEHWFLTYSDLNPFFDKIKQKINDGHAGRIGLEHYKKARAILESKKFPELEKLDKAVLWGTKLNDPRISWGDIERWGQKIEEPYKENLVKLLGKI